MQLLVFIAAALAGAISHELAHWVVWVLAGRDPQLDLWGLEVIPQTGPAYVTAADRYAAAAPYVVGLSAVVLGVYRRSWVLVVFGVSMIQLPSHADVATIRGNVTWRTLAN